jgi:predicted DNA-binding transcriptional regulator AlpA
LEWKLAVDRCHLMDTGMTFLLPVVIEDTRDDDERVPERFREVQWTRLPDGVTPAAFVERVRRLLAGESSPGSTGTESTAVRGNAALPTRKSLLPWWRSKAAVIVSIAVVVGALSYVAANRLVLSKRFAEAGGAPAAQSAPATTFSPPPHSIAVLPFVNISGDKQQQYFSDGLTEELLNSLSRINELQVRLKEIKQLTGLSTSTIYKYVNENRFPKAVRLGERSVAWRGEDVLAWQKSRAEWHTMVGPNRLKS